MNVIRYMLQHRVEVVELTAEHLWLVGWSTLFAALIGIPLGALAGYFALAGMQQALPIVLALAAASLLYVAVADLIPSLHRRPEPIETLGQVVAIGLGIAIIGGMHVLLEH